LPVTTLERGKDQLMKALGAVAIAMFLTLMLATTASAAPVTVPLLTASPFAILAGTDVTDVPTSAISGDVGLTPAAGSFYAGLTCAEVSGTIFAVNAAGPAPCVVTNPGLLTVAKNDLTTAYDDAAARIPDVTYNGADNQLGGLALVSGTYRVGHAATANLVGNLTLDGAGNADAVWIFQATSDLVFASSSTVTLTGGAQACNVFWQVGSAATLHTSANLVGTILAHDDISVDGNVTLSGRLLAGGQANHAGAVTLIQDTITAPSSCVTQASINSANAAAAQTAADQAAAAQAAAAQAAAAQLAATQAAAAQAAAAQAAAAQAAATQAAVTRAAQAAKAAKAAAAKRARVRAAAVKAAKKTIAKRRAAVRAAKSTAVAAFTG
jgi:hypothetical protein